MDRKIFKSKNECPNCGEEENIDWFEKDIQDDTVFQKATCLECGCEFKEYFEYSNTEIIGFSPLFPEKKKSN